MVDVVPQDISEKNGVHIWQICLETFLDQQYSQNENSCVHKMPKKDFPCSLCILLL